MKVNVYSSFNRNTRKGLIRGLIKCSKILYSVSNFVIVEDNPIKYGKLYFVINKSTLEFIAFTKENEAIDSMLDNLKF